VTLSAVKLSAGGYQVTASGTYSHQSEIDVFVQFGGAGCAATDAAEQAIEDSEIQQNLYEAEDPVTVPLGPDLNSSGSYRQQFRFGPGAPNYNREMPRGTYWACAYLETLNQDPSAPPEATASAKLTLAGAGSGTGSTATGTVYRGKDSRGEPVTLTEFSGRRLAFSISFVATGYSTSGQPDGSTCQSASFFTRVAGVRADAQGRFSHQVMFQHHSNPSGTEYFNGDDLISGRIQGRTARGSFSSDRQYYKSDGTYLGPCKTGLERWVAQKA